MSRMWKCNSAAAVAFWLPAGHNKYCFYLVDNTTQRYIFAQKNTSVSEAGLYRGLSAAARCHRLRKGTLTKMTATNFSPSIKKNIKHYFCNSNTTNLYGIQYKQSTNKFNFDFFSVAYNFFL